MRKLAPPERGALPVEGLSVNEMKPQLIDESRRQLRHTLTHNLKALIPLKQQDPNTRATPTGRVTRRLAALPPPHNNHVNRTDVLMETWWLVGCTNLSYVLHLCQRFEAGFAPAADSFKVRVKSGNIPLIAALLPSAARY